MTRTEHLLTLVAEECNEVAQRCMESLRFGLAGVQPGQAETYAQRIIDEVNDLLAVYRMLTRDNHGLFCGDSGEWYAAQDHKQAKVEEFLKIAARNGRLEEPR